MEQDTGVEEILWVSNHEDSKQYRGENTMSVTEIIKAVNEPAVKLIEAVSGAIGKAYEPRYVRKMADAKAYEIAKISEEIRNNSDLPIVYNGETSVDITDYDALRQRAGARLAYQEIKKQENIEAIVDKAYEEVLGKTSESEASINQDWMSRFIANAGEVSDEEMQTLWSKVLAGEAIAPKSFSLKTLDCLRNLTSDDAELFVKVCSLVIQDDFLINDDDLNNKYGLNYGDILRLDDCGLLNSSGIISMSIPVGKEGRVLLDFEEFILLAGCSENEEQKISIGEFPLTRAGKELLKIARTSKWPGDYIKDAAIAVKNRSGKCDVSLHKVNGRNGNNINYELEAIV